MLALARCDDEIAIRRDSQPVAVMPITFELLRLLPDAGHVAQAAAVFGQLQRRFDDDRAAQRVIGLVALDIGQEDGVVIGKVRVDDDVACSPSATMRQTGQIA